MKNLIRIILLFIVITACSSRGFCQDTTGVKALIHQGIALNDSGKYDLAIEKYKAALKIDPKNLQAQYEMSYTLASSGRTDEAIPILEKVAASDDYAEAFDLLASIYDDKKDYEKAVAYYQQGIIAFPDYQRLRFNLGISYLRQGKYPEAEAAAIKAIELNPKHASSHRLYALATYKQKKNVPAIMAFCTFLLLEPQTQRSAEAFQYIQNILQSKFTVDSVKDGKKSITIYVQDNKDGKASSDDAAFEMFLSLIAASPTLDENKNKSAIDMLNEELGSIFEEGGELAEKNANKDFFWKFYVAYFYKLKKSDNMPAFTRLVSLSGYRDENIKWFKENGDKLDALKKWAADTQWDY